MDIKTFENAREIHKKIKLWNGIEIDSYPPSAINCLKGARLGTRQRELMDMIETQIKEFAHHRLLELKEEFANIKSL